jgi:DNA-binding MarR family transcriptional regulator
MSRCSRIAVVVMSLLPYLFSPASADEQAQRREAVQQRIAEMKERLELTPAQEAALKPIVESHVAKLREIRSRLGSEPTRAQKREAAGQLRELGGEFSKQVQAQLTPEQQAEWKKLREENRDRMHEQIRKRRAG